MPAALSMALTELPRLLPSPRSERELCLGSTALAVTILISSSSNRISVSFLTAPRPIRGPIKGWKPATTHNVPVHQHYISPIGSTHRVVVFPFGKVLLASSGQDALITEDYPFNPFHCGTSLSYYYLLQLYITVFSARVILLEGISSSIVYLIWCCIYGL